MAFQRGGSYHAGFLRGKAPNGTESLFVDDSLVGLAKPEQVRVLWYSASSNSVHGYMVNVLVNDEGSKPFFVPIKDEVRYVTLDIRAYINGLTDGLLKRASDIRTKRTQQLGA